jgi:hypothetical protein
VLEGRAFVLAVTLDESLKETDPCRCHAYKRYSISRTYRYNLLGGSKRRYHYSTRPHHQGTSAFIFLRYTKSQLFKKISAFCFL